MTTPTPTPSHRRPRAGRTLAIALAVPIGLVASGALVWQASYAAFTASTDNTGNSWSTGTVDLSDNDSGTALFDESALDDDAAGAQCIQVTYSGTLDATVTMSATASGALAPDIAVVVSRGTGTDPACGDFVTGGDGYTGTLDGLPAGLVATPETWAATAGTAVTYRISWDVQATAGQGETAAASFTWTATS